MSELKENLKYMKEIVREIYAFSNTYESNKWFEFDKREKEILKEVIIALTNQLKILNKAIPKLVSRISLYPKIQNFSSNSKSDNLTKISYKQENQKVSLVVENEDREKFLENLSKSNLAIKKLEKKNVEESYFIKPNPYAKISNYFFRDFSNKLIDKGYFRNLNINLRRINSRFVLNTYVSIIFFTALAAFFLGFAVFIFLLFFKISFAFPFIAVPEESFFMRFFKFFWIIIASPIISAILVYIYPLSEAKSLGAKIDNELPFVTIHMSAIATSGVEPTNIFKIIIKSGDYKYTNIEFKKIINLMNFHGEDLVSALRKVSSSSSSKKLKELLNGLAVTITSGGELMLYLNKQSENLLFEYKIEREKYNKLSETFMDIYISVAIAAPMIFLMIFVIIGSTGLLGNFLGLSVNTLSFLLILVLILLNVFFLVFLRIKQPPI